MFDFLYAARGPHGRPSAPEDLLWRALAWQKRGRKRCPFSLPVSANFLPGLAASWSSGGAVFRENAEPFSPFVLAPRCA